jgi:hypothetical protein
MATAKMSPKLGMIRPNGKFRQKCYDIANSDWFEISIAINITISTVILCIKWP